MVAFWLSGQRRWSIKGSRDTSCCVGEHQRQGQVRISSFRGYLGVTNHCPFHCDLTGLRFVPRCRWGRTPLQDAVDGSHFAMVAMLRSKGGAMPESLSAMQVSERGNIWSSLHSFPFLTHPLLIPSNTSFFSFFSPQLCYAASRGDVQSLRLLIDCAGLEASLIVLWQ